MAQRLDKGTHPAGFRVRFFFYFFVYDISLFPFFHWELIVGKEVPSGDQSSYSDSEDEKNQPICFSSSHHDHYLFPYDVSASQLSQELFLKAMRFLE